MQHGGELDAPVWLRPVLQQRRQDARDGEARTVQRMDELGLGARLAAMSDCHAARLIVAKIGAGRDLKPTL